MPAIWYLELGNVLIQAERRNRLSVADIATRLELFGALPITIDDERPDRTLQAVLTLARAERLTTYDAAYLELAMRRGLPLASKDQDLVEAARRCGVVGLPVDA